MTRLLHLDASVRRQSFSRQVGAAFAETWRCNTTPDDEYVHRDLAANPVPLIDEAWTEICDEAQRRGLIDLPGLRTAPQTPAQVAAWQIVEPLLSELASADIILIATPMYNYSIPASLKAWIDQVTFPRFSLAGRRVVVASARGGSYAPGAPKEAYDHQERYLRDFLLGHFAIDDVTFLNTEFVNSLVDPNLVGKREQHEASFEQALTAARDLAKRMAAR